MIRYFNTQRISYFDQQRNRLKSILYTPPVKKKETFTTCHLNPSGRDTVVNNYFFAFKSHALNGTLTFELVSAFYEAIKHLTDPDPEKKIKDWLKKVKPIIADHYHPLLKEPQDLSFFDVREDNRIILYDDTECHKLITKNLKLLYVPKPKNFLESLIKQPALFYWEGLIKYYQGRLKTKQ